MTSTRISPRLVAAIVVLTLGVTIALSIGTPAAGATTSDSSTAQVDGFSDSTVMQVDKGLPDCTRCHEGVKASGLNPTLCGECHQEEYGQWTESGHADALMEGSIRTQIINTEQCAACHVERDIKARTDIDFQTREVEIKAEHEPVTCEVCHSSPENGWFYHFGIGESLIPPEGIGPHGEKPGNVNTFDETCQACHSNSIILELAGDGKIDPHSTALRGSVDGGTDGNDGGTQTTTETTTTETPGFGPAVALLALVLGSLFLLRRR